MNYVATYHIGQGCPSQIRKAEKTAPTVGRLRKMDATTKGHGRNQKGQATAIAPVDATDGFLRNRFLPKLERKETIEVTKESTKMERDFYRSLSQLAKHYHIEPMEARHYNYPYNIALSLWDAKKQLKATLPCFCGLEIITEGNRHFLQCEERYGIGTNLYYIPIVPLFLMSRNRQTRKIANLLFSVCCYLRRIVDIPYYRDDSCYLSWQYEMMSEWVANDEQTDATAEYMQEIEQAEWIGDFMEQKICNPKNLEHFEKRVGRFRASSTIEVICHKVAREAYALYKQYPNTPYYRYAKPYGDYEEDEVPEVLTIDRFVSFYANCEGWLNDSMIESLNCEFAEYGDTEEPALTKRFDGKPIENSSLDFENRLFNLIDDLIIVLRKI